MPTKKECESEEPRQSCGDSVLTSGSVKVAEAGAGPRENYLSNHYLGTIIAFTQQLWLLGEGLLESHLG